ncbi:MAG: STAS/SEC14 domain-containing protein [Candidatus Woykebacteria bacterium]
MKSDEELLRSFKLYIGEDDIAYLEFLGAQDVPENNIRQAELIRDGLTKLLEESPERDYNMLIDLTATSVVTNIPDRSKEIYAKSPVFKKMYKIAVVTPSLLLKILTSAVSLIGGKYEGIKSFDNREEALGWLKPGK